MKLITYLAGLSFLIWGALYEQCPDWDIGVSLLMSISTYLTAEWVIGVIRRRAWAWLPLAVFYAWWCVDGSYWLYWSIVNPSVMIREGQWAASLCLYLLAGVIWSSLPMFQEALARLVTKKDQSANFR